MSEVFGFILRATGRLKRALKGETALAAVWAMGSKEASDMKETEEAVTASLVGSGREGRDSEE